MRLPIIAYSGSGSGSSSGGITIGTTAIASGTDTRVLFDDSGVVGEDAGLTYTKGTGTLNVSTIKSLVGAVLAESATAPAAAAGASQAGKAVTITSSVAVASTDTDGAAAGGNITITAGNAARRNSGNAAGGVIDLITGLPVGTGTKGWVNVSYAGQAVAGTGSVAQPALTIGPIGALNSGFGLTTSGGIFASRSNTNQVTVFAGNFGSFGAFLCGSQTLAWAALGTCTSAEPPVENVADTGIARPTAGILALTDGSASAGPLWLTTGTMTYENGAQLRSVIHSFTWTNAQVVALGASLTGDITVCTLPAKTIIKNAYIVITGTAAGVTTLTVALGRVSASYIDYIVASDAKVAVSTVYGDVSGERGTNLTGYDLPSYTGTTDIKCHFISTVQNLDQTTGSTGRVIIETALVP